MNVLHILLINIQRVMVHHVYVDDVVMYIVYCLLQDENHPVG